MTWKGWEGYQPKASVSQSTPPRGGTGAVRPKYGATPTVVDGIRFDSEKEAKRYGELKLLEKAGEIHGLALQPSFDLMVISKDCRSYKVGEYRADFSYHERGGYVVEDVKGFKTPLYRWKKKHVEAQYGIEIRET